MTADVKRFAALLAIGPHAALSSCTAAAAWGFLSVGHCDEVQLVVPGRTYLRLVGVTVHRPCVLEKRDLTLVGVLRLATPARTVLDLSSHLERKALEDALDHAIRLRLIRVPSLLKRIEDSRASGRTGMPLLAALLRERAHEHVSGIPAEAALIRLLKEARLPLPEREVAIVDDQGQLIGRVDFAYRDERIAIEVDGYAYHSERERWESDYERRRRLTDAGWLVLSFTPRGINQNPNAVVRSIRQALRRHGSGLPAPQ